MPCLVGQSKNVFDSCCKREVRRRWNGPREYWQDFLRYKPRTHRRLGSIKWGLQNSPFQKRHYIGTYKRTALHLLQQRDYQLFRVTYETISKRKQCSETVVEAGIPIYLNIVFLFWELIGHLKHFTAFGVLWRARKTTKQFYVLVSQNL